MPRSLSFIFSRRWLVAAVLLLGVVLRFYNLTDHGLAAYDEAAYMLVASDEIDRLVLLSENIRFLLGRGDAPETTARTTPTFHMAKPVYSLVIACVSIFTGWRDWTGALVSGIASVLFLPVLYISARRAWPTSTRTSGAVIAYAALSPILIHYSHATLAESLYLLFHAAWLGTLILLVESSSDRPTIAALSGVLAGFAFLTHYRFAPAAVYGVVALAFAAPRRVGRVVLWGMLGFLLVFLAFWLEDALTFLVAFATRTPIAAPDLIDQFITRFSWDRTVFSMHGWNINLVYWLRLEPVGLVVFLLVAAASLFKPGRAWRPADRLLAWCLVLNLLHNFFSDQVNFSGSRYLRSLTNVLPSFLLLLGRFYAIATSELPSRPRRLVAALFAASVIATSYPLYRQITSHHPMYAEAFAHLREAYGGGYTTAPPIGMFYLGRTATDFPFSPFTRVRGDGMLVDYPDDAAKFGVAMPGEKPPKARRAELRVLEIWERPETCFSLPMLMESGAPLDSLERWQAEPRNRRFYFGRIRFDRPRVP